GEVEALTGIVAIVDSDEIAREFGIVDPGRLHGEGVCGCCGGASKCKRTRGGGERKKFAPIQSDIHVDLLLCCSRWAQPGPRICCSSWMGGVVAICSGLSSSHFTPDGRLARRSTSITRVGVAIQSTGMSVALGSSLSSTTWTSCTMATT